MMALHEHEEMERPWLFTETSEDLPFLSALEDHEERQVTVAHDDDLISALVLDDPTWEDIALKEVGSANRELPVIVKRDGAEIPMTNNQPYPALDVPDVPAAFFVIEASSFIRHSSFVIFPRLQT